RAWPSRSRARDVARAAAGSSWVRLPGAQARADGLAQRLDAVLLRDVRRVRHAARDEAKLILVERRKEDDLGRTRPGLRAQELAERGTVERRHHRVEDDDVRSMLEHLGAHAEGGLRRMDDEAAL